MSEQSFNYEDLKNEVYDSFVKDTDDIIGMIAYSIYKGKKIKLIKGAIEKSEDGNAIKEKLRNLKVEAIKDTEKYRQEARLTSEEFVETYNKIIISRNRATLLAHSRTKSTSIHKWLMLIWGILLGIVFLFLFNYLDSIEDEYEVGRTTFRDSREILFYFFERYTRRLLIIVAAFYAIKVIWHNFRLSFNSLTTNVQHADNLRIFDYIKNEISDPSLINNESLRYVFLENDSKESSKGQESNGSETIDKLVNVVQSLKDTVQDLLNRFTKR